MTDYFVDENGIVNIQGHIIDLKTTAEKVAHCPVCGTWRMRHLGADRAKCRNKACGTRCKIVLLFHDDGRVKNEVKVIVDS